MYSKKNQLGVSLISLMIGIFISMMCILASMTLYKHLISAATETKLGTIHDGQIASAMLTTQLEVQAAGFGIDDADNSHIQVVDGGNTQQVYWRYFKSPDYICRGLNEDQEVDNNSGITYRRLTVIKADNCDAASALAGLNWQLQAVLGRWAQVGPVDTYITNNQTLFNFQLANDNCSPFGNSTDNNHYSLVITVPGTAFLNGANGVTLNNYRYCLPNTTTN